jgi:hypothetical protein
MYRCQPNGQRGLAGQQALDDFGREGGKVVRPPRKPVMANSFQASGKCVFRWNTNGHADQ